MTNYGGASGEYLRQYITKIERLEEEKAGLMEDIREIYKDAKDNGFEPKIMRQVIKIRKMDTSDRQEQEATLDTYLHALGMAPSSE